MPQSLEEANNASEELIYLNPALLRVIKVSEGIYSVTLDSSKTFERVHFFRAFPETFPDEYIEVWDSDKEAIGMMKNLDGMEADSKGYVIESLTRKYFRPRIQRILSLRVEFGFQVWQVETDKGQIEFTVSQPQENISRRGKGRLLIKDVDDNVFEIQNWRELDPTSRNWLESRT